MKLDKKAFALACKASIPVIFGYLPTGFAFGLMLTSVGYNFMIAILMSTVVYAGAGQYLAVDLFKANAGYLQIAIMTFLINSKHLFYGLSLLEDYKKTGKMKPYMIFSLTDETYAILTGPPPEGNCNYEKYMFYVSIIDQTSWIAGTILGALFGLLVNFNSSGIEFAMTALFVVILLEQWKTYKTKIPFLIGSVSALAALFLVSKENMLLMGAILSVISLIVLRKRIEENNETNENGGS